MQQPWSQDHCEALTDVLDRAALLCAEAAADMPQVIIFTTLMHLELQTRLSLSIARFLACMQHM